MKNKKIERVVRIARRYIRRGYKYSEAVRLAEQEVTAGEIAKYESKI